MEASTVFSPKQLAEVLKPFTNRRLTFAELIQARSLITQLYVNNGYTTSGALIPPQSLTGGVVKIQVVEGELESINVTGLSRFNSNYVRSRIAVATKKPVNVPRLLDGRSPSVSTFRRRAQITQANLLGLGDDLSVGYTNTDGSNGLDISYTLTVNARNGTRNFAYGTTSSNVIEAPFNKLNIISDSRYYELTFRQPVIQTPSQELAVGIAASRRSSETSLLDTPYPLSQGADDKGRTRISAVRFFQEWTQRSSRQVIAARSQFTFGIDAFNATINQNAPDSNFFSWRGQGQWVRLLSPDTLFLVRGDVQLADRALVPTEQFGLGGLGSVLSLSPRFPACG
ncbi:MAG: ShlB/FhaC/HecB family hemolysin secretion/activation protein [Heteroscytonema crispum UTEX LB 1556]